MQTVTVRDTLENDVVFVVVGENCEAFLDRPQVQRKVRRSVSSDSDAPWSREAVVLRLVKTVVKVC